MTVLIDCAEEPKMLKLRDTHECVMSETGKYRIHAKRAMFETDPVKKKFFETLAANAMSRAHAHEDSKDAVDFAV
jgi:hypothetical protein